MLLSELFNFELMNESLLVEGLQDKNIFKAVLFCGSPGAGKNSISNALSLEHHHSLKMIDVDQTLMRLKDKGVENIDHKQAHWINARRQSGWINQHLGLCIVGTGRVSERILKLKDTLEENGYQTCMIFVDVPLETALKRTVNRAQNSKNIGDKGRTVPPDFHIATHKAVSDNVGLYRDIFDYFVEISTDDGVDEERELDKARKMLRSFFYQPLSSKAKEIIGQRQQPISKTA